MRAAHPVVSAQIGGENPASAIAAMAPIPPSDSGAPAAQVEPVRVDSLSKINLSSKDKAIAYRNPVAGGSTFMDFTEKDQPQIPQSMSM
jgi:hypothetical protein